MRRLLPPALVALAAAAVFTHTLAYQFVYDDVWAIARNPRVHSLAHWPEILSSPYWKNELYRPLTSLSFAADWSLWHGSPAGFHLSNILSHVVASLLVFALAGTLLPPAGALAAALLFAVHPVHVEAVANVVGRAEILATVFALLTALWYGRAGDRSASGPTRVLPSVLVPITLILALASKESAFAIPGLLLVVDWWRARGAGEPFAVRFRRQRTLWFLVLLVALLWLWIRAQVMGDLAGDRPAPGLEDTGPVDRLVIMLPVATEYVRLLLAPLRLSADYSPDFLVVSRSFTLPAALGLGLVAGCLALALAASRRAPAVTGGIAWTGVSLFVVSNVLLPSGVLLAERTVYLASVGACLALGWVFSEVGRRRPAAATALLVLVVALGAVRSWTRATVWRDEGTFFHHLVLDAPGSYRADWVAGMRAYIAGDADAGERLMKRGLRTYPGNPLMWIDFAKVMEAQGRWSEAARYHWAAFLADPTLAAEAARAVAGSVQAGELDAASARLDTAQRLLAPSTDLTLSASHLALARGEAARATRLRLSVARTHPGDWRYWLLTGQAALAARDCAVLTESLARVVGVRPSHPQLAQLRDGMRRLRCAEGAAKFP